MAKVIAMVSDIFFGAKISAAAKQVGVTLEYAGNEAVLMEKAKGNPSLFIFDLNQTASQPLDLIAKLKANAELKGIPVVGFLSHVQTDLAAAAQQAGCDQVMPRSAFSANLPAILQRGVSGVAE